MSPINCHLISEYLEFQHYLNKKQFELKELLIIMIILITALNIYSIFEFKFKANKSRQRKREKMNILLKHLNYEQNNSNQNVLFIVHDCYSVI